MRFRYCPGLFKTNMGTEQFSLKGRTALVTGSSTGLGKRMAVALGKAGAKVAMNYFNNEERAAQALSEFEATGAEGAMIRANVTDEADVNRLVAEAGERLGPIDIVILNATPDQPQKPIEEYDWAFYQSMLDFFIKSRAFDTTRARTELQFSPETTLRAGIRRTADWYSEQGLYDGYQRELLWVTD